MPDSYIPFADGLARTYARCEVEFYRPQEASVSNPSYETEHGTVKIGTPELMSSYMLRYYMREDLFTPKDGGTPGADRIFVVDAKDLTPQHKSSNYNPHCPACWLNNAHSEAYHAQCLEEAGEWYDDLEQAK